MNCSTLYFDACHCAATIGKKMCVKEHYTNFWVMQKNCSELTTKNPRTTSLWWKYLIIMPKYFVDFFCPEALAWNLFSSINYWQLFSLTLSMVLSHRKITLNKIHRNKITSTKTISWKLSLSSHQINNMQNTEISPNFLVWKFCGDVEILC